jgi:hypothetical protein
MKIKQKKKQQKERAASYFVSCQESTKNANKLQMKLFQRTDETIARFRFQIINFSKTNN